MTSRFRCSRCRKTAMRQLYSPHQLTVSTTSHRRHRWTTSIIKKKTLTQGSDIPQTVVHGGKTAAVLGMAELGEQHGRAELSEGDAKTKQDSAAGEYANACGSSLHDRAGNHDDTPNDDGRFPSISICEKRSSDERC